MAEKTNTPKKTPDYYAEIQKYLNRIYPNSTPDEIKTLRREVVFAPTGYTAEIAETKLPIAAVRETLANAIERDNAAKDFIPYSLDAELADLIEKNNCETSSMNEYYRWISATAEIVRNTGDGEITKEDLDERKDFITMSFDREAEILLCLALYEAAGIAHNKEKIDMMRFKLARLREMRSIVSSTPNKITKSKERERLEEYYAYCCNLLKEKPNFTAGVNVKLNLNINHNGNSDLEDDFSYLDYLRQTVLYMMRWLEKIASQNERSQEKEETNGKKGRAPRQPLPSPKKGGYQRQ